MTPAPAPVRNPLATRTPRALVAAAVLAWAPLVAGGEPLPVVIEGGSCPSAVEVREQLEPLLGDAVGASLAAAPAERLRVVDYGDRYRIEVGTTAAGGIAWQRTHSPPRTKLRSPARSARRSRGG